MNTIPHSTLHTPNSACYRLLFLLVAIRTTASEGIAYMLQLRLSSRLLRQTRLQPTSSVKFK